MAHSNQLMTYAELFCQSNFSFLEGASHPEELIMQAHFLGYEALALTDECSIAGVVRAHTAIKEYGLAIKLITGSLFHLNDTLSVILLCPDRAAYAELCRTITNTRKRAEKGKYVFTEWDLIRLKHCLIIWLPKGRRCASSALNANDSIDANAKPDANAKTDINDDHAWAKRLRQHHEGRCWIGLQRHLKHNDRCYRQHCLQLSEQYHIPITACGGVLMHAATRLSLQHVLSAIKYGTSVQAAGQLLESNTERSLRSIKKLARLYPPEYLFESVMIARRCEFKLSSLRYEYPRELVPDNETANSHLRKLVEKGIQTRFPEGLTPDIRSVIEKELTLIEELDYPYFFLTIHDVVMFAKSQGILYQGRGSAANSIVCYCLEITAVDPRQISVLFERFISKERNEPPDIDVDFEHERREEVIQYIYQKYGRERAALAATVITYRFKSAVREVGKALGIAESQLDFFIKNVNRRDKSLGWQAQIVELGLSPESEKGKQFIALVNEIIGFPRHLSQHVGGFVISAGPLYELVPVENASMIDRTIIQWDKDDLESLGLLKVDVLALGMLTAIRKTFDIIHSHYGHAWNILDITRLQDDPQVYQMIQQADTVGVFQIESRAQMSMLPRLKPATYYDLVIQIAIVRPGPIQGDMVHPFLKRRNGEEAIEYPSEAVKEVLERTLGVPIFQEQVIKLAMVAAGFTGGEADRLRRAMASWKKTGELMQFKTKLINGMLERDYDLSFAERIFDQICGFGEYGFPESHSASFAVLAYTSAWLKKYYPCAFYTALLNSLPMGFYSASQLVQDAQRHGLEVLPVCINQSQLDHHFIDDKRFRLGFRQVKGLSDVGCQMLIDERPKAGFSNLRDIKQLTRIGAGSSRQGLSRKDLESLASADAFRVLEGNRYSARWRLMDQHDETLLLGKRVVNQPNMNRTDAIERIENTEKIAGTERVTRSERTKSIENTYQVAEDRHQAVFSLKPSQLETLNEDYAALGLSLSFHPVKLLEEAGVLPSFRRANSLKSLTHKTLVDVVGVVTGRQSPGTAAGVTFVTLEDDTGNINVVVWAGTSRAQKKDFLAAKILHVRGILEREGEVVHVIAGKLNDITNLLSELRVSSRDFH